jgi:hypothetical protein
MATKSLYELEDVCATFMYALETQNHTLVLQTARELRISGEMDLLVNFVTMSWLLCDPHILPMYHVPSHETLLNDICLIMEYFPSQLPKYKSQLLIPLPSSTEVAKNAIAHCLNYKCWKPCLRMLITFLHKDNALLRTILIDQFQLDQQMLEMLDRIVYQPLAERFLYHIVIHTIEKTSKSIGVKPRYTAIWNSLEKGRAARVFQIPVEALSMWSIRPKSYERLQGTLIPRAVMDTSCRSMYWTLANPPPKEENIESWFEEHFPDDIPDEWSRSEIEKSHMYELPTTRNSSRDWQPAFLLCWS